jgi:parallel beta-helix repeat protein
MVPFLRPKRKFRIQGLRVPLPAHSSLCAHAIAIVALLCSLTFLILLGGCGGNNSSPPPPQSVIVMVSSSSSSVLLGNAQQFTATVTGTSNTAVTWSVNGVSGGNSTAGTISSAGLYTAPQDLPNPANVTIQATSQANSSASGSAVLTITSDIGVTLATNPSGMSSVFPGGMVQLVATVTSAGHPDANVNWAVNGVPNGNSTVGTIAATGAGAALYTAPATAPNPASVNITADCVADSSKSGNLVEAIQSCTLNGTIGYVAPAPYVPPSGSTCDVSDVSTLGSCVAAVRSGATTNVRFTAMVNCSGNGTCLVDLTNVHGPITFFGAAGITAGFLRTDSYSYPMLNLSGASDLTLANLTFDEGPDDPACTPYQVNGSYTYPCQSTISIDHASNITLEQVSILHSKDHAIAFSATQGIAIEDSLIQDAGVFGIWSGSDQSSTSNNVSITNNLIQDVKSNGIFLSFTQNTTIRGNTFKHNHHVALFNDCNGLCPGGQIDMLNNSSLRIYSNEIRDGQIDLNNATGQTDGIEIANQNTDVIIMNNEITNNLGAGIAPDPGTTGSNFRITGNKIYNNGTNLSPLTGTGIQESGDCFTQ